MFLDILVGYFIRSSVRFAWLLRARNWTRSKAIVTSLSHTGNAYGGDVAEVYYKYYVDGVRYADVYKKAFIWPSSAKDYAKKFARGDEILIRVKPGNPAISIATIASV